MKVIIDIPDNIYDAIKKAQTIISGQRSGKTLLQILVNSVENGTPLPKGHGRLIDADAVLEEPIGNTYKDIDIAETIIEADMESEDV